MVRLRVRLRLMVRVRVRVRVSVSVSVSVSVGLCRTHDLRWADAWCGLPVARVGLCHFLTGR